MQFPVIDTHVHLDELNDPAGAILEAQQIGLSGLVAVGMDLRSNEKILSFSRQYPGFVFPAIGYHPWNVSIAGIKENITFLRNHLDQAIAMGEIGLDYKTSVPRELQDWVFKDLLELALEKNKPVILHCRLAHEKAFELTRKYELKKAVFHWYSGPLNILKDLLLAGYYISATPALAHSLKHREAVAATPLKQILIETDSPVAYQGETSSPVHVLRTLNEVSKIKGIEIEQAALKTTQNARDFFGIV